MYDNRKDNTGSVTLRGHALILGVNGVVGQAMARQLVGSGVFVQGVDLHETAICDDMGIAYEQCDATELNAAVVASIGTAPTVLVCLPENVAMAVLPTLVQCAAADALIVDTLSVKEGIVAALQTLRPTQQWLSINPMFSPRVGFDGQNVATVQVNDGPRVAEFESLLESWGAATVSVSAEEHDKMTSLIQVATHAAIMSIGLTLQQSGYDVTNGIRMVTPPHRVCQALLARMADASPDVYWDIQKSNKYGADARDSLLKSVKALSDVMATGEPTRFEKLMAQLATVIEPLKGELLHCADSISAQSSRTPCCDGETEGKQST